MTNVSLYVNSTVIHHTIINDVFLFFVNKFFDSLFKMIGVHLRSGIWLILSYYFL